MQEPIYHYQVGDIRCTVISDTIGQRTLDDMYRIFPTTPQDDMKQVYQAHFGDEPVTASMNCLLIQTGERLMLVDTGQSGQLYQRLCTVINPAELDTVIITHAHGDHVGGLTTDGQLTYPNADYFMTRAEWEHWADKNVEQLDAIKDRLTLIDSNYEFAPGVRAVPLPGHTPGQIGLFIESQGAILVHLADAIHFPFQLNLTSWVPRFDSHAEQAAETRQNIVTRAEREGLTVLPYHFRFPGVGKIVHEGERLVWQPVD